MEDDSQGLFDLDELADDKPTNAIERLSNALNTHKDDSNSNPSFSQNSPQHDISARKDIRVIQVPGETLGQPDPTSINLNFETAKLKVSSKLLERNNSVIETEDDSLETEFDMDVMERICGDSLVNLGKSVQYDLFNICMDLHNALTEALSANLAQALFERLIALEILWPNIRNWIGTPAPLLHTELIGRTDNYRIFDDGQRKEVLTKLTKHAQQYKSEVQNTLLTQLLRESKRSRDKLEALYARRYDTSLDDSSYMEAIAAPIIASMRRKNASESEVKGFQTDLTEEMRLMTDEMIDTLIYFAYHTAVNRQLANIAVLFEHENMQLLKIRLPLLHENYTISRDELNLADVVSTTQVNTRSPGVVMRSDGRPSALAKLTQSTSKPVSKEHTPVHTPSHKGQRDQTPNTGSSTKSTNKRGNTPNQDDNTTVTKKVRLIEQCQWDRKGCDRPDCRKLHTYTPLIACSMGYNCDREKCIFNHPPYQSNRAASSHDEAGEVLEHHGKRKQGHRPFEKRQVQRTIRTQQCSNISPPTPPPLVPLGRTRNRSGSRHRPVRNTRTEQWSRLLERLCSRISNTGVNVLNDCYLSRWEFLALSLGVKFALPPSINLTSNLLGGLARFTRSVRIRKYFCNTTTTLPTGSIEESLHKKIRATFTLSEAEEMFTPKTFKCPIEHYLRNTKDKLLELCTIKPKHQGICTAQWYALKQVLNNLRERKDIIIKPADKNLGLTVMKRDWYIQEATSCRQLGNTNTYTELTTPPNIVDIAEQLRLICMRLWWSKDKIRTLYEDLTTDYRKNKVKLCRMYFLPKLHKNPVTLRAICASQGWITYWTSVYIHLHIFPLLKMIPTYISNSAHLVQIIEKMQPPKYYQMVEADVDNLYPSINIDDGLNAMKVFLKKIRWDKPKIEFILALLRWVLKNNYVTFGTRTFLQISGTAMGTPCAVVFACIYMHIIEEEALDRFLSQNRNFAERIYLRKRFIDDLAMIFSDYELALKFITILNSIRPWIKLTFRIRNMEAQFLDLTIYKTKQHAIKVKAYTKPMNKFLFLPPSSCHPSHCFTGWIKGYCQRLRLNCSEDSDFNLNMVDFRTRLLARGYSEAVITPLLAATPSRTVLLNKQYNKRKTLHDIGIPFIITYSPIIQSILPAIKSAIAITEIAYMDPDVFEIFGRRKTPLFVFKRSKNIQDIVAPSALPTV